MPWQPPTHEPDPLSVVLSEAVRTHLFPAETGRLTFAALPDGPGRQTVLVDGSPVRIRLNATPETRTRHRQRPCAGIRLHGHMTHGGRGYRVEAEVVIDLATRAVLACRTARQDVGPAMPADLRRSMRNRAAGNEHLHSHDSVISAQNLATTST